MINQKVYGSRTMHLAKEIVKFLHGLSSPVMRQIFKKKDTIRNLRNFPSLYSGSKNSVKFTTETIMYRGPQIWNLIHNNIKNVFSLENIIRVIKKWSGEKCPWRICKRYLPLREKCRNTEFFLFRVFLYSD